MTRARLVAATRELLADTPFDALTTDAVIERAGISRGGLYHHFPDLRRLFEAVNEQLNEELLARVAGAISAAAAPSENLRTAAVEFLRACTDPLVAKVVLLEGPAVLGQEAWLEDAHARWAVTVQAMLEACAADGAELPGDADLLAHLLISAVDMAGILVARDPELLPRVEETVIALVDKLLAPLRA